MITDAIRRRYIPKDAAEFGPKATEKLAAATQELAFLMNRGIIQRFIPDIWIFRL